MKTWTRIGVRLRVLPAASIALMLVAVARVMSAATPPGVGDPAPNFTLNTLDNKPLELKELLKDGTVLLVVLRGWPGYQCPICTRQVHDFITHADTFVAQKAQVLFVYPGPAKNLKAHAQEFLKDANWPKQYRFVIDPDYKFTLTYHGDVPMQRKG